MGDLEANSRTTSVARYRRRHKPQCDRVLRNGVAFAVGGRSCRASGKNYTNAVHIVTVRPLNWGLRLCCEIREVLLGHWAKSGEGGLYRQPGGDPTCGRVVIQGGGWAAQG
jgi:hypothetical protein